MKKNNLTIPDIKGTSRLFWAGAMLAAFWIGMNLVFPQLAPTGIPMIIVRIIVQGLILAGLWLGLSRTAFTYRTRATLWLAIAIPFTLWLTLILELATHGFFQAVPGVVLNLPVLPIATFLPVVVGLILLTRSGRIASLLDAMPTSWLIGIQLYRVYGSLFLVIWLHGILPGAFALPAGIGDAAVGVLALPAAALVASGTEAGRKAAMRWNILGLIDLAIAISMGIMTSLRGPFHGGSLVETAGQLNAFPTVMTPGFVVPLSAILHGLSIWQLKRRAQRAELSHVGTESQLSV